MAKAALDELLTDKSGDNISVEKIDIIKNPLRTLKDGVKFIPTLKCGDKKLSGVFLSKAKIANFLMKAEKN